MTREKNKQKSHRLTRETKRLILGEDAYAKTQALSLVEHKEEEARLRHILLWLSVVGIMGIVLFGWIRMLRGTYSEVGAKAILFNGTSLNAWKESLLGTASLDGEKNE